MEDADADDFDGEDGGGNRRTEEGGEHGAHAAHDGNAAVVIVKAQKFAEAAAEPAPELQGGALPADGSTAEMGEDRGDEDERSSRNGDVVAFRDCGQDHIGPAVLFLAEPHVKEGNDRADEGQEVQDPGVIRTDGGDEADRFREQSAGQSAGSACGTGKKGPLDQIVDAVGQRIVF